MIKENACQCTLEEEGENYTLQGSSISSSTYVMKIFRRTCPEMSDICWMNPMNGLHVEMIFFNRDEREREKKKYFHFQWFNSFVCFLVVPLGFFFSAVNQISTESDNVFCFSFFFSFLDQYSSMILI